MRSDGAQSTQPNSCTQQHVVIYILQSGAYYNLPLYYRDHASITSWCSRLWGTEDMDAEGREGLRPNVKRGAYLADSI